MFMRKWIISITCLLALLTFTSQSFALCINVDEANLRNGPGTKYEKTWEVFKYMPFKKISKKGNWYKVSDVDKDTHWIYRKLATESFKCAVVKVDKANIRSGPGTGYSKSGLSPVLKYDAFKVLQIKSPWVKVIDEFGDSGWIYRKLVWIQ